MITENLLFAYSAQVMILVAAAAVAVKVAGLRHAKLRLAIYQGVLAICVLLPFIEKWLPREASSGLVTVTLVKWNAALGSAPSAAGLKVATLVLWAVAAGAALRLAWIACGLLRLRELRASSVLLERSGKQQTRIYVSPDVQSPATYGILRPVILLPEALQCNAAVLRHELIHIERRDWLWRLAEECVLSVFWFHPAMWWLKSEIELAREQVVDHLTVRAVGGAGAYVDTLVDVAARRMAPSPMLASEFIGKSSLKSRVEMLLSNRSESRSKLVCSAAAICACLLIAGWTSARALPLPTFDDGGTSAHQNTQKTNSTSEKGSDAQQPVRLGGEAQQEKLVKKVTPVYPKAAKEKHIQGQVVLDVTISKEGNVTNVEPVSGPAELIQSAVDAVKQWEYRPTLLNGNPVDVESEVHVNYTLTR